MWNGFNFILIFTLLHCALADTIVSVEQGLLNGTTDTSSNGREFLAFRGIPYAEPPVGDLRFRSPVAKKPWCGVLQAHNAGNQCAQNYGAGKLGSEDCLYLNVYTPRIYTNGTSLLPVMVYIHGGGYNIGSGSVYRPGFLLDKNTVLVTFNYRLGIFGFLSTGDLAASGNYGLKDQQLVLKWVQQNIKAFGGNPDRVTLFGESSGGASVNLHALSERSKPLFHQYIIQSGSILNTWAFHRDAAYYEVPKQYAKINKCPTDDSYSMINCLRTVDANRLLDGTPNFDFLSQFVKTAWTPVVEPPSDDAFITEFPENLLRKKHLKDSPVITGTVNDEGLSVTAVLYSNETTYQVFLNKPLYVIEGILTLYAPLSGKNTTDLAMKIKEFYFGSEMPTDKTKVISDYTKFVSDAMYLFPQLQLVEYMRRINVKPVYFYNFNYSGIPFSLSYKTSGMKKRIGVAHGDELPSLFPIRPTDFGIIGEINYSDENYKIVNLMVDSWTTFASTSVPKSTQLQYPALWQSYKVHRGHLEIGYGNKTKTRLEHSYFAKRMKFWYDNVPPYLLYEG